MLKLYKYRNSICTQRVLITLAEKALQFQSQEVNLFLNEQYTPTYLAINPKGVVPALVHNGDVILESTIICEYLEEVFPINRLMPDSPLEKSRLRVWSKAVDDKIFVASREISFSAMFRQALREMTEEQREVRFKNVGDPERTHRFKSVYQDGVESHYVMESVVAFERLFQDMEKTLSDGRQWLGGDLFSLGDISLIPFVARMEFLTLLDIWTLSRPNVIAWYQRAKQRDSFKASIAQAIPQIDKDAMRSHGSEIFSAIAQKRTIATTLVQ